MEEFVVYGIGAVAAIATLVELVKFVWPTIQDRLVIVVAIGIGLALSVAVHVAARSAVFDEWFRVVWYGLFCALAAGGLYGAVKKRK